MTLDYGRFEALTFDCYGTLIDWETGLLDAFRPILAGHAIDADDEDVLVRYARHEAAAEAGPYLRYRDVLAAGLRGVAAELGFTPTAAEVEALLRVRRRLAGLPGLGGRPGPTRTSASASGSSPTATTTSSRRRTPGSA